jgi:hypothetical protein
MSIQLLSPFQHEGTVLKGIPDGIIYHYTNLLAFRKIIENGVFHLTHYRDLKDNKELVWALDHYTNMIKKLFPSNFLFTSLVPDEYYIFCTCKRRDNRFLWERYASIDAQPYSGIVLGINAGALYQYYNRTNRFIDMTPMDYDPDNFLRLCEESVEGLLPINFSGIAPSDDWQSWTSERKVEFLMKASGYREYRAKRNPPLEALFLQKGREFAPEEEIRILNWPEIHKQLPKMDSEHGKKTVLPWRMKNGHFIVEIISTDRCEWDEKRISRYLRRHSLQTKVTTLQANQIV